MILEVCKEDGRKHLLIIPKNSKFDADQKNKLYNEFKVNSQFNNKNILKINNLFDYKHTLYLITEQFDGIPLSIFLENNEVSLQSSIDIILNILYGLKDLHAKSIIHRNLNPFNILINPETYSTKIIGLYDAVQLLDVTKRNIGINYSLEIIPYFSPEATGKTAHIEDKRSDLYSVGMIFYRLLFRSTAFFNESLVKLVFLITNEKPHFPDYVIFNRNIPNKIIDILKKLLDKSPDKRYQSVLTLIDDLVYIKESISTLSYDSLNNIKLAQRDALTIFFNSHKLFGREMYIKQYNSEYELAKRGMKRTLLIQGEPGIGKSAFIEFLLHQNHKRHVIFMKLDQYNRDLNFTLLTNSLRQFISKLLTEEDTEFKWWQLRLQEELGNSAQVLIEFIPELKKLISFEGTVKEQSGLEALNRFKIVLQKLINCLSSSKFPLTLIIDDIHWANQDIREFITTLLQDIDLKYLLLVLTYRPEDLKQEKNNQIIIEKMKSNISQSHSMTLNRLSNDDIKQYLKRILDYNGQRSDFIINIIQNMTLGIPLVIKQFIKELEIKKLLYFDESSLTWEWDEYSIKSLTYDKDLFNLLKIHSDTQEELSEITKYLQIASCIGKRFDYKLLSELYFEFSQYEINTSNLIDKALYLGLISEDTNANTYIFQHDSIREYFYNKINSELKLQYHLAIGRRQFQYQLDVSSESIFSIVEHFNIALELIKTSTVEERCTIAELNYSAGKKLLHSIAFRSSLNYLMKGIELLPESSWKDQHNLTQSLFESSLEAAFLNGNEEILNNLTNKLKEITDDKILLSYAVSLQIRVRFNLLKFEEALSFGLSTLNFFNISIQLNKDVTQLYNDFQELENNILSMSLEKFISLPEIKEKTVIAKITILESMLELLYTYKPELYPIFVFKILELTIKHGSHKFLGNTLANTALLAGGLFNDIDFANEMSLAGVEKKKTSKDIFIIYFGSYCWKHHYKDSLGPLKSLIDTYIDTGEFSYSGFASYQYCYVMLQIGYNLNFITEATQEYQNLFVKTNDSYNYMMITIIFEVLKKLQGKNNNFDQLEGQVLEIKNLNLLSHFYNLKLFYDFMHGASESLIQTGELAFKYILAVIGSIESVASYFFFGLAILKIQRITGKSNTTLDAYLQEILSKFEIWSKSSSNFEHKYELLKAESYRLQSDFYNATMCYERALQGAKNNGYPFDEALIYELGAEFYFDNNAKESSIHFINSAVEFYRGWGAKAKLELLKSRYSFIPEEPPSLKKSPILTSLDYSALLKTITIISSESDLFKLIYSMIDIVIEQSGSEKCLLLLKNNQEWMLYSNDACNKSIPLILQDIGKRNEYFPYSVMNYSLRTNSPLLVHNPTSHELFFDDNYILKNSIKSIMCLPLNSKDNIIGFLYLDSKNSDDLFNESQLEFIKLLSTQFIISIENATLWQKMTQKIKLRNEKLEIAKLLVEEEISQIQLLRESNTDHNFSDQIEKYIASLSKILNSDELDQTMIRTQES